METSENFTQKSQPTRIMFSYGSGKFLAEFIIGAFGMLVFKFFETNIKLDGRLTAAAIIIYSIWNAINDPLVGHFTAKPTRFSKKWGRRFPWIFMGSILWALSFILIFAVPRSWDPVEDQWLIFAWMVITTCLFDFIYSIWDVNYQSLFPDKFRSDKERGKATGIATLVGVFGIAAGALIWTFIIDLESSNEIQMSAFLTNSLVYAMVGLLSAGLLIPGVKEDRHMIARFAELVEKDEKGPSFFQQLKVVLKQRNFVAFILFYFLYQAAMMCLTASIAYLVDYILPSGSSNTLISAGMLVGALIAIPSWLFIRKKVKSNQKLLIFAALFMAAAMLPMTWLWTQNAYIIAIFIWGLGFGGFWMMMGPAFADVIDEIVVKTKKRDDGVFMGFRAFFGRLSWAVQAITFSVVHELTEFDKDSVTQSEKAQFGIHLHMAAIPACFLVLGAILFAIMNTLNEKRIKEIQKELKELDL